jgi:hypothetical protein
MGDYPFSVVASDPCSIFFLLSQNMRSVIILDRFAMNLVTTVRLEPEDPRQLLALIEHFNYACNELSRLAFDSKTFG